MLQLTNAEGSQFNVLVDDYLSIKTTEETVANVTYEQLQFVHELLSQFDDSTLVVECDYYTQDIIKFLENIDKIVIFKETHLGSYCYFTIQKSQLNFDELN